MRRIMTLMTSVTLLSGVTQAGEWELAWSDEFNTKGLPDKTKWDYEEGFCRNEEKQYYTRERKENVRVEGGSLVIEGRKETFFVDDKQYATFNIDMAGKGSDNPFRKPHYLLLNLAMGGSWGGQIDDNVLPRKYEIDYVRYYKAKTGKQQKAGDNSNRPK